MLFIAQGFAWILQRKYLIKSKRTSCTFAQYSCVSEIKIGSVGSVSSAPVKSLQMGFLFEKFAFKHYLRESMQLCVERS